ncbi:MAG: helix-turn-helix transcriptional regulator [Lachnospiraceae bacterium]|nr:helix-turn-helix transcriptional regulator [Lachnospiraceae bacterium]
MDSEDYGSLVKNLRQKTGLTQSQVAESLGVTPGYISNVENNRTAMSLRILTYYARLVGCSLDSLVGELEPEYAETALDRELYQAILKLDTETKEKLLKTIELWSKK